MPAPFLTTWRFSPVLLVALVSMAGCAAPVGGVNDPLEPVNRSFHAVNKGLDRVLVSPGAKVYGGIFPDPVEQGVQNFASTLDQPGDLANHLLQGDLEGAGVNFARFALNAVFGLGGLFDVATEAGVPEGKTDFGETLHVWGFGEGPYLELPILGPSTTRDTVGSVVDIALNPVSKVTKGKDATVVTIAQILSRLGDRSRYSDTVDSILYDSADSYAQARLLYLQNRRFELGQSSDGLDGAADSDFIDPYEDPYAE